jgi:hypothetical protein
MAMATMDFDGLEKTMCAMLYLDPKRTRKPNLVLLHYGQNTTGVVYLPWEFVGLVFIPIAKKYPRIGYAK